MAQLAVTRVQGFTGATSKAGAGSTLAVTSAATVVGNLLLIRTAVLSATATVSSISGGGTWTKVVSRVGTSVTSELWMAICTSSVTSFTVTFSAATLTRAADGSEYNGVNNASTTLATKQTWVNSASTSPATATVPSTTAGNLLFAAFAVNAVPTGTFGGSTNYTTDTGTGTTGSTGTSNVSTRVEYDLSAPGGSQNESTTITAVSWAIAGAEFRASNANQAQAQANIKAIGVEGFAQAQADIKATTNNFAQAQAYIPVPVGRGVSQAAATITGIGTFPFTDSLGRTVGIGMGLSDNGDTWEGFAGSVNGSEWSFVANTRSSNRLPHTLINFSQGFQVQFDLKIDTFSSSLTSPFLYVGHTQISEGNFGIVGSNPVYATLNISPTNIVIESTPSGFTYTFTPNLNEYWTVLIRRVRVSGNKTNVRVKAFKTGSPDTGTWTTLLTANSNYLLPGNFWLSSESVSGVTLTASVDNIKVEQANLNFTAQAQAYIKQVYPKQDHYTSVITADGAVSYWRLGESSGTTATDSIGSNTGTYTGTVVLEKDGALKGNVDTAADLSAGYVSVTDSNSLDFGDGPFSLEFWLKQTSTAGGYVLSKGTQFIVRMVGQKITIDDDTNPAFKQETTATNFATDGAIWHHYVVTHSVGATKIYRDGVDNTTALTAEQVLSTNATNLAIGSYAGGSAPFAGYMDEVAIYPSVLTSTQIAYHYSLGTYNGGFAQAQASITAGGGVITSRGFAQAQTWIKVTNNAFAQSQVDIKAVNNSFAQSQTYIKARNNTFAQAQVSIKSACYFDTIKATSGLVGYWRLGETAGATALDETGTNNGAYIGSPTLGAAGLLPGDNNTAMSLTTNSMYMEVAANAALDLGNTFTIEIWAKRAATGASGYLLNKGTGAYGMYFSGADNKLYVEKVNTQNAVNETGTTDTNAHHWMVVNNAGTVTLYKDGVNVTNVVNSPTFVNTANVLQIGHEASSSGFIGTIDEVSLYNVALTLNQVQIHYNAAFVICAGNGLGQAQAQIKQTYRGFAQAQVAIKQTYQSYAQAQSDIKQIYIRFAQSQADIKQVYQGYAQGQTNIKQTYQVYAQSQANIKATSWGFAQAQTNIKATSRGLGQAQADIKATSQSYGQAQTDIKATSQGYSQGQADIKATSIGAAQAQADIKTIGRGFAQGQADIKQIYQGYAQGQADIKVTTNNFAQSQADIKATSIGAAQAQSDIKTVYQGYAQAQAKIATTRVYGQAQTDIKATSTIYGQAQVSIKATSNSFAQSQADVKAVGQGFAQSQTDIKATTTNFAQAQSDIKQTYTVSANAQAHIAIQTNNYAQVQTFIAYNYLLDTFTRTLSGEVGTADSGQSWVPVINGSYVTVDGTKVILDTSLREIRYELPNTVIGPTGTAYTVSIPIVTRVEASQSIVAFGQSNKQKIEFIYSGPSGLAILINLNNTLIYNVSIGLPVEPLVLSLYIQASGQLDGMVYYQGTGVVFANLGTTYFNPDNYVQEYPIIYASNDSTTDSSTVSIDYIEIKPLPASGSAQAQAKINAFNVPNVGQAQARLNGIGQGSSQAQARIGTGALIWVQDTFTRTETTTWGTPDIGPTYISHPLNVSTLGVNGSKGTVTDNSNGGYNYQYLPIAAYNTDISIEFNTSTNTFGVELAARTSIITYGDGIVGYAYTSPDRASGQAGIYSIRGTLNVSVSFDYSVLGTYKLKLRVFDSQAFVKVWLLSNPEPVEWAASGTIDVPSLANGAYVYIDSYPTTEVEYYVDNLLITEIIDSNSAQAQASIVAALSTNNKYAQAQAQIKNTYQGYAQAQSDVKQTYSGFAQAQANIKQTYAAFAQAQTDIRQAYQGYANAQAQIRQTYNTFAQAQAQIKQTYQVFSQANADIKQTYTVQAQAQATIKAANNGYGQTQTDIKQTYQTYAQAQAAITTNYIVVAQAQADIKQTYQVYSQAQTDIKQIYQGFANVQAEIKQVYTASANAQADIKQTYSAFGQTQANILQTYQSYAQAQTQIKATYNGYAQAQAAVKATYQVFAQAQAKINAFGVQSYAQAQTNIRFNGNTSSGQAQARINAFGVQAYGQSQVSIKATNRGFAQAQTDIKNIYAGYAQTQAQIKNNYQSYAQAQSDIKATINTLAQAQTSIKNNYAGYSQAQADIKAVSVACGQAQAIVGARSSASAQAQTDVKATSAVYGQAQADIKQKYTVFAQANARIKNTYQGYAQAQAYIKLIAQNTSAQTQAAIRTTSNGFAQSQTDIRQIYAKYAQAQVLIKTTVNTIAQAQTSIANNYQASAQAQAFITKGTINTAQAQAYIQITAIGTAQAQALIIKAAGFGQAQALIRITHTLKKLVISDRSGTLTLSDKKSTNQTIIDKKPIKLVMRDSGLNLTLSNTGLRMTLTDKNY